MLDFPNFFNLGDLSAYFQTFAGLWAMVSRHMIAVRAVGLSIWLLVTLYAFYERYRHMGGEDTEEWVYQALRSGLALGAITFWPELFQSLYSAMTQWADSIPYQESMMNLFRAMVARITERSFLDILYDALSLGLYTLLPFGIFIVTMLFFIFAYAYLLLYQAVATAIAYILGPLALALYPSTLSGKVTANFLKATIKILLLPLLFAIFLDAFLQVSIDLFTDRPFGFVHAAVLGMFGYVTLKLPRILDSLDTSLDAAGHFAGGTLSLVASSVTGLVTYLGFRAAGSVVGSAFGPVGAVMGGSLFSGAASSVTKIASPKVSNPSSGGGGAGGAATP